MDFPEDVFVRGKLGHSLHLKLITLESSLPSRNKRDFLSYVAFSFISCRIAYFFLCGQTPATIHAFRGPPSTPRNLLRYFPYKKDSFLLKRSFVPAVKIMHFHFHSISQDFCLLEIVQKIQIQEHWLRSEPKTVSLPELLCVWFSMPPSPAAANPKVLCWDGNVTRWWSLC